MPLDLPEIRRLEKLQAPRALAFVADYSRKGAVRAVRVAVLENWPEISAAAVAETRTGTHHVLPHRRLAPLTAPASRKKLRLQAVMT